MKALILSGGAGTRLRPLTHTSAKQLIPIANKPIIFYGIEAMAGAGIKEFGIIVGETASDVIKEVGDGKRWGVKITYIKQDSPLGLAHAVKISEDFIKNDSFIMYLGDNILKEGIPEFINKFNTNKPNSLILLTKVPNPQQFGVAEIDKKGKIYKLVEKPKNPKSNLALVGIYLFDNNIFKAVNSIKPSARGELEITDAISWLLEKDYSVEYHEVCGWWKDTGKPSDILDANRLILKTLENNILGEVDDKTEISDGVVIQKGAKIVESTIRGPAIIGENARIKKSFIGPFTSIGYNVIIENSEIENSIVMEGSRIIDINGRIDESILGRDVSIVSGKSKPVAHRFVIGDRSDIILE